MQPDRPWTDADREAVAAALDRAVMEEVGDAS